MKLIKIKTAVTIRVKRLATTAITTSGEKKESGHLFKDNKNIYGFNFKSVITGK